MRDYFKLWRKFRHYIQGVRGKIENHIRGLETLEDEMDQLYDSLGRTDRWRWSPGEKKAEISRFTDILEHYDALLRQMDWLELNG